MTVVVRRYQLRAPTKWGEAPQEQIRLQREMWNRLVALDQEFAAAYRALTDGNDAVAAAARALDALVERRTSLIAERKRLRREARRRQPTPDIDAALAGLKPEIAAAKERLREARREARAEKQGGAEVAALRKALGEARKARAALLAERDGIDPPSREQLAAARQQVAAIKRRLAALYEAEPDTIPALEAARQRAVTQVRQEFAGRGLYWGNYNAVIASYRAARARAIKAGARLKFHGAGDRERLTVQVQGGMSAAAFLGGEQRLAGAAADPGDWRSPKAPGPMSGRRGPLMRRLSLRIDGEHNAEWPMLMSRPMPEAEIKQVVVTRQRIASHWRHAVVVTATREDDEPAPEGGPVVAVDLGWRRLTDGIRVATAVSADGRIDHVICPERIIAALARVSEYRSRRDELRTAILGRLRDIEWSEAPAGLAELGSRLRLSPPAAFSRIAKLAWVWHGHRDWRPADCAAVEQWRRADKRLWESEANLRDHAVAARTDHYRKEAARLAAFAGTVVIEEFNIAAAARIETPAGDETTQQQAMRSYRTIAAPASFRDWLTIQARKRGVNVVTYSGASNDPHAECGVAHAVNDETALRRYCPSCGAYYDVDENACRNMLAAYVASGPETPAPPDALAAE